MPSKPPSKPSTAPRTKSPAPTDGTAQGDRIAKVLARSGVASRRVAETMISEGRVAVNGKTIDSPALNVGPKDRIAVDGKPVAAPEPTRVWLYHKPVGLVTSERDEKGRETVFDALPEDLPRVMSVGRLDLNSEGLLLLTNDGDLKRRLELPATGWLRKYRVRVNGTPTDTMLEPLRKGVTVEGERFQPMMVAIDRQQGANAWLTIGIREGRNREIRRAMEAVGLTVNRLIRVSYGPFQLGDLPQGAVEELRPRVLRDQLGLKPGEVAEGRSAPPKTAIKGAATPSGRPRRAAGPVGQAGDAAVGKPGRKSWGSKSLGAQQGPAKTEAKGTKSSDPTKSAGKPRSWGTRSAQPTGTTPPRRPRGKS